MSASLYQSTINHTNNMKTKSKTPTVKSVAPASKITTAPEQTKETSAMIRVGNPPIYIQMLYPNEVIPLPFDDEHDRIWQEPYSFNDRNKSLASMPPVLRSCTSSFNQLLALTLYYAVTEGGRRSDVNYRFSSFDWYMGACKIGDRSASTFEAIIALLREIVQADVDLSAAPRRFYLKIADDCSEIENLRHDLKQNPNRPNEKTYSSKMQRLQRLINRADMKVEKYVTAEQKLSIKAMERQLSDREVLKRRKSITNTSVE